MVFWWRILSLWYARFSLPGHKLVLHSTISFVSPHSSPPFSGSDSICLVLAVVPVPHDLEQALQLLQMVNLQSTKWKFGSKPYWVEWWKWNYSILVLIVYYIFRLHVTNLDINRYYILSFLLFLDTPRLHFLAQPQFFSFSLLFLFRMISYKHSNYPIQIIHSQL